MLWNFLKPILIFIPIASIQLVIVPLLSINDINPNIIVILICFYTLKYGQIYGTLLGFVIGLIFDLISGGLLGAFMLTFTIAGFSAGYFYNENKVDIYTTSYAFIIVVFLCSTINSFLYTLISSTDKDFNIFYLILEGSILPGLYTAFFSLPVIILNSRKAFV
ncbi:rod shape-determining protein MreD [Rosettibacter firmus]|uniref:rod shape-determining protein MreD n=1 Tax=Rosettibacter firmus TaxID=3111522 RepID=UPI00336BE7B3